MSSSNHALVGAEATRLKQPAAAKTKAGNAYESLSIRCTSALFRQDPLSPTLGISGPSIGDTVPTTYLACWNGFSE